MCKKTIGVVAVVAVIAVVGIVSITTTPRMKKVDYTYTPVPISEINAIRGCIKQVTGSEVLDLVELQKDQILLSDVYRYCLKTVEDVDAVFRQLSE